MVYRVAIQAFASGVIDSATHKKNNWRAVMAAAKLSQELIEMGRTGNGGYTKKQLKLGSPLDSCLTDKLYGDKKGYLSKALEADLLNKGVKLITTVRKNMKAKAMSL